MARSRLAVALVVPEPFRTEIDGLRRAVGGDIERIAPHITLVPPVNVRDESVGAALEVLRDAAAGASDALTLTVGPAASFVPTNRVLYLAVGGAPAEVEALASLRAAAVTGVLHRDEQRRFIPHVTLTNRLGPVGEDDDTGEAAAAAAQRLLAGYRVDVTFERLDLLQYDGEARRWSTVADAPLGPRRIVGRGGLALELTTSMRPDPEVAAFMASLPTLPPPPATTEIVLVAGRREGEVVGVASGHVAAGNGWCHCVLVAPDARRTGVGGHLLAALQFEMAVRGARTATAERPDDAATHALLVGRGWRPAGEETLTTTLRV